MPESSEPVTITLRIPGQWKHPRELYTSLPKGVRMTPETMRLHDGPAVEFNVLEADKQFYEIFRSSCRQPPTPEEVAVVKNYTVNVCLSGPGGSMEAALAMMQAGCAILQAGAAGVFIDNCGLAHGGTAWQHMTEDAGPDALSFAFVNIVRGQHDVWTTGMHCLGLRDIVMKRTDIEEGGFDIVEVIRYMSASEKPIGDGHVIADLEGPRFRTTVMPSSDELKGSAMHNPYGKLKLVSLRDIAESN